MSITRPILVVLLTALLAVACYFYGVHVGGGAGYTRGHADALAVQGRWDAEHAQQAAHALDDDREQRRIEQRRSDLAQESHDAYLHDTAVQRATDADLRAQLAGLRNALEAADADRLPAGGAGAQPASAGGPDDAAILRELFGECSERYAAVASTADAFRHQVSGLQGYVRAACGPAVPAPPTPAAPRASEAAEHG